MFKVIRWCADLWREDKDAVLFAAALIGVWMLVMAGGAW